MVKFGRKVSKSESNIHFYFLFFSIFGNIKNLFTEKENKNVKAYIISTNSLFIKKEKRGKTTNRTSIIYQDRICFVSKTYTENIKQNQKNFNLAYIGAIKNN